MFHRTFPEIKISASLLHRTYKKLGIRFKYISRVKKEIDYTNMYYLNLFTNMYNAHKLARIWNMKIVYVDEAVFTFNTFRSKAWSQKNTSIRVQESAIKVKTMALIAAISEDGGLEAYSLHPKSIKTEEFVAFVEKLSAKFEKRDFAIFLDNL